MQPAPSRSRPAAPTGALAWIEDNQLNRRNLTADQVRYFRGRQYNREKGKQGGDHKSKGQIDTLIDVASHIATEHGVSSTTVKRDGKFAEDIEQTPELHEAVMIGLFPVVQDRRGAANSTTIPVIV